MDYSAVFFEVFRNLGKSVLVIGAFYFGRHFANVHRPGWKNYLVVFAIVGAVSLMTWSGYGTHVEDADPIYGGGEIVVDFEPSGKERNEYGVTVFLSLIIPALFGVYKGQEPRRFVKRVRKAFEKAKSVR